MALTLSTYNFDHTLASLKLAASLFDRYRFEIESQSLWAEIKYVLDVFAEPFTIFFKFLTTEVFKSDPEQLLVLLPQLKYMVRVFHCLTAQDFPEYFEDNNEVWFSSLLIVLRLDLRNFKISYPKLILLLDKVKARIIQVAGMFIHKYFEDFQQYANSYIETVWQLSVNGFNESTVDELISECVSFMRIAFAVTSMSSLFNEKEHVINLCNFIIVPNLMIQNSDQERFEDDPEEYVRLELEGDAGSRRHSTSEFVSSLAYTYETILVPIFLEYTSSLIQKYNENPLIEWKSKDAAIRLIIAMTNKFGLQKFKSTELSSILDISKLFTEIVLPDLLNSSSHPILLGCCLKYLITFHKTLPPNLITDNLGSFIFLFSHPSLAIQYLFCVFLDDIFLPPSDLHVMARLNAVHAHLQQIYMRLLFLMRSTPDRCPELPHQSFKTVLIHTHNLSKPYIRYLFESLISITSAINSYSVKPQYLQGLYDSFCLVLRMSHIHEPQLFAELAPQLITKFPLLIEADIHNSTNYIYQTLSVILFRYCPIEIPEIQNLYPRLLTFDFWDGDPDHFLSCCILSASFMKSMPDFIFSKNDYNFFVSLFEKYSKSSRYDLVVFNAIKPLVLYLPFSSQVPFPSSVFESVFRRLTTFKKPKFVSSFCDFLYVFLTKFTPQQLFNIFVNIQPDIISRVIENLMLPELYSPLPMHRKSRICIATAQLLFMLPQLISANSLSWVGNICKLLSANPPSDPPIDSQVISFYASLENTDPDLIPRHEHLIDQGPSALRFARHILDPPYQFVDAKSYIFTLLTNIKPTLDPLLFSSLLKNLPNEYKEILA